MCIIAYKPSGEKFPSKNTLKTMFRNNPDGAGFMFNDGDHIHIEKGFMAFSAFQNALSKYKHLTDRAFVLHFRIATHGGINKEMTQPFPLSAKNKQLRSTNIDAPYGVAHNGIISLCNDARKLSDTAQFISQYMTRICSGKKPFDDINLNIIESCINSRMVILEPSGTCHILGKGWIEDNNIIYSNDSYIDWYRYSKSNKKNSKNIVRWDDEYFSDLDSTYNMCCGDCEFCRIRSECWGTPSDLANNYIW